MAPKFYKTFNDFKNIIDIFFKKKLKESIIRDKFRKFASDNFYIRNRELFDFSFLDNNFYLNFFGK